VFRITPDNAPVVFYLRRVVMEYAVDTVVVILAVVLITYPPGGIASEPAVTSTDYPLARM
jgi:hypothetical protein